MKKYRCRMLFKIILFLGIGAFIFAEAQRLLLPKWYYPDAMWAAPNRAISGFYEEMENSIDVIAIGTSMVVYGYSPMHVYDKYGIKSYNLATSAQPIEVTYFMLKEALKSQNPKVIILDTSSLYFREGGEQSWRYVIDNIPMSLNKIELAYEFSLQDAGTGFLGAVIPIWRYHDRWKELAKIDWTDRFREKSYYAKGYSFFTDQEGADNSVNAMNEYFQLKAEVNNQSVEEFVNDQYNKVEREEKLYDSIVSKEILKWFEKIKNLCDARGINLLIVSIPRNTVITGWNSMQYQEVKEICQYYNLEYFDMMYDCDIGINWNTDTEDNGRHLNFLGAYKASESIGRFLVQNYNLDLSRCADWDENLAVYKEVEKLGVLQTENNFEEYIKSLSDKYSDKTIFISASDDFYNGLTENEKIILKEMGLQSDFQDAYRKSFVAVIEKGEVRYEALSNGVLVYNGVTDNNHRYMITSSGWLTNSKAQISINDTQYAVNSRGLNIVLYDDNLNIVLDSVCFDTFSTDHTCIHHSASKYLKEFEIYVIENEN